jgi:hypothetical protein
MAAALGMAAQRSSAVATGGAVAALCMPVVVVPYRMAVGSVPGKAVVVVAAPLPRGERV